MIRELLSEDRIVIRLAARDLRSAVQVLVDRSSVRRESGIVEAVLERERLMTTGLGKGAALPRIRTDRIPAPEMAIATIPAGLNCGSIDRKPVQIIFLHILPARETGAALLGQSLRLLNDENLRPELIRAATPAELLELIERWERA